MEVGVKQRNGGRSETEGMEVGVKQRNGGKE